MKKFLIMTFLILSINLYAQNMEMTDTEGKTYSVVGTNQALKIEGMNGKMVFLEFFGLQCPACKEAMPHLINIENKYKDKVKIMAIEVQNNDVTAINAYKKKYGINYTTFSNYDVGYVVRFIADKSNWKGAIPFLIAIGPKGQVKFTQAGVIPEEILEKYIKKFSK